MPSLASKFLTWSYYRAKPFLPRRLCWSVRQRHAGRILRQNAGTWPIDKKAGRKPGGWPGWPGQKEFAFVLTHDVESEAGLEQVRPLAELEMELGFRSSFNFIPEGPYEVPSELRQWLVSRGFEVGIHDLHHDGRLYASRRKFRELANRINRYLVEWGATGFRSGFMMRKLDWLHDLEIQYDASTFDTDPFEPQPDGCGTIFPFHVPSPLSGGGPGYIELPYTLAQDSTLFLLLGEKSSSIWKRKLAWIAEQGGLALLNVHPDYMNFDHEPSGGGTYPAALYREFLESVHARYGSRSWHALPAETAGFAAKVLTPARDPGKHGAGEGAESRHVGRGKPKIWIDLDNTPHVPFFEPIMEELESRGYPLLVTARDAFQVCELAAKKGLACRRIGRHHGKNRAMKAAGLVVRGMQLAPTVWREKPVLGVSHGARSQLLVGKWLGIPTLLLEDYEYCQFPWMMSPTWIMAPEAFSSLELNGKKKPSRLYPGIKEDVYAGSLRPDADLLDELGLSESDLIATVRPPATEAHYHNPEAELLFEAFMERAFRTPGARVVLLPRNARQAVMIRDRWPHWFEEGKTIVPERAVDGMNLIWHSDLVVSGGGTMNREAAALGVPVYSIFRGTIGAVDKHLTAQGRLVLIETVDDVDGLIKLEKRDRRPVENTSSRSTLQSIVEAIIETAEQVARG